MHVRGAFNHLLRPGLREDFRDSYESFPEEYGLFLLSGTQDRAEVERAAISGLGRMSQIGEIEPIPYVDAKMSDKYTFVDDEFGLGFQISRRMVEDDQYDRASQNAKWLGRAARLTQEYQAAAMLDDAFTGAIYTGLFDEALIATDHTLLNATGTWSNRIANNPSLSVTAHQAALELAESQVDHQGDPMPMVPSRLLVDRTDEQMAIQLIENPSEPFTANRNINAAARKASNMSYELLHYKTADGSYFYQDQSLLDAHFLFRRNPEFGDEMDKSGTRAALYFGTQRILTYFFDQRGWIGSDGTGT